jgi:hypothetical protein
MLDAGIHPAGQVEKLQAAAPVHRLFHSGDFTTKSLPLDGALIPGSHGCVLRAGDRSLLREDWQAFLDFADQHFGAPGDKDKSELDDARELPPPSTGLFRGRS